MHVCLLICLLGICAAGDESDLPRYVGRTVCLECHGPDGEGHDPCAVAEVVEHGKAYDVLHRPEAMEIAALCGEPAKPHRSMICLACHATGGEEGPRWALASFNVADGVQCEACHGPGSMHIERRGPGDEGDRSGGFLAAGKRGGGLRSVDHGLCGTCHRELPSHRMVLEGGYRRSPVNDSYKTPVNLAVSGNGRRLYVVCQQANRVMIADTVAGTVIGEIAVGRRPHDAALSPDGRRLYVTNRLDDSVSVIDTSVQKVIAVVPVGDEPHGVLAESTGRSIFVLNTDENTISVLDAQTLREVRRLVAGRGPWSVAQAPNGGVMYVTSVRPHLARFREPHESEVTVLDVAEGVVRERRAAADANMLKGVAFVPAGPFRGVALCVLMRSKDLVPATRLAQGWTITNGLGVIWPEGRVDQVLLDQPWRYFPDPNDVAVSPDGRWALVTSGGGDEVAVVDVGKLLETITGAAPQEREEVLPNHLGQSSGFVVRRLQVGGNPRGVVFSPDGASAYVACALDDCVTVIDTSDFSVRGSITLGGPTENTELRWGERLFHSARITFCGQFSCQSCHPDGHLNGLTVDIEADGVGMKPVDNRTLRGIVDTGPFKWEGTNPSLLRQCGPRLAVFFTRLAPFSPAELQALVRYECTIERPPNRYRAPEGLTPAQYRGKLVFERGVNNFGEVMPPEQRCNTCHNGPYKTAQTRSVVETTMWFDAPVDMPLDYETVFNAAEYGDLGIFFFTDTGIPAERLDAPHLSNIYNSAPYMHNGSAPTLEEVWTRFNFVEGHGLTMDLTRQQFNDLIAYLRTL